MSSSDLVAIYAVRESTPGVTPTNPIWQRLRQTGESLNFAKEHVQSGELNPQRAQVGLIPAGSKTGGDINFELSAITFDDLIAAAFGNEWVDDGNGLFHIVNGVLKTTFSIMKVFTDISGEKYHIYRGMAVDGLAIKMAVNKIIEGTVTFMGLSMTPASSAPTGSTYSAVSITKPMSAGVSIQDLTIQGVPYSGCVSQFNLTLKNNTRTNQCLTSINPTAVQMGSLEITGDANFYFSDSSIYRLFYDGVEFPLSITVHDDDGNQYVIQMPNTKFESGDPATGQKNTDVMFNAKWRALLDPITQSVIRINATRA